MLVVKHTVNLTLLLPLYLHIKAFRSRELVTSSVNFSVLTFAFLLDN